MTTKVTAAMLAADVEQKIEALIAAAIAAIPAPVIPPSVPAGSGFEWYGASLPDGGYLWQDGSAVSRTTYAALFAAIGTTFGVGNGTTTFNLPDARGRVAAGKDDMGGTAAGRMSVTLTGTKAATSNGNITGLSSTAGLAVGMRAFGTGIGANAVITAITSATAVTLSANSTSTGSTPIRFAVVDGATLGASGGSQIHTLSLDQIPAHEHGTFVSGGGGGSFGVGGNGVSTPTTTAGGGQAHPVMQPTLVVNKLIKY